MIDLAARIRSAWAPSPPPDLVSLPQRKRLRALWICGGNVDKARAVVQRDDRARFARWCYRTGRINEWGRG